MIRERKIVVGWKSFQVRRLQQVIPQSGLRKTKVLIEAEAGDEIISIDLFPVKQLLWMLANPDFAGSFVHEAVARDLAKLLDILGKDAFAYWLGRAGGKRGMALNLGFLSASLGQSRHELRECLTKVMDLLVAKKVVLVADAGCSAREDLEYLGFSAVNGSDGLWIFGGKKVRFDLELIVDN